jgi:hypothetical protein
VADQPPQPRRVQPAGGVQQHRLGLGRGGGGQVGGAGGQHGGVRGRQLSGREGGGGARQRPAEDRPGGLHGLVGGGLAQP